MIEQLAARMGAMESLLGSMSPEQRAELQDAIAALLRDDRLAVDLARLAGQLDMLLPGGLGQPQAFTGDGPLGLEQALGPARTSSRRSMRSRGRSTARRAPAISARSTASRCATCSGPTPSATSTPSTTSPASSKRRATWSVGPSGSS